MIDMYKCCICNKNINIGESIVAINSGHIELTTHNTVSFKQAECSLLGYVHFRCLK